jgi:hypothetical protein
MHYTYTVHDASDNSTLATYQAPATAKYSTALAHLKAYAKRNITAYVVEKENDDIITREQCEYILK